MQHCGWYQPRWQTRQRRCHRAIISGIKCGHQIGVVIRLATKHDPIDILQMLVHVGQRFDATIEDDFKLRKVALQLINPLVTERWYLAVFFW